MNDVSFRRLSLLQGLNIGPGTFLINIFKSLRLDLDPVLTH